MEIYQNVWRDKKDGVVFIDELHLPKYGLYNESLLFAIANYKDTNHLRFEYVHTMVSNPESGRCFTINIQNEIYGQLPDSKKKEQGELSKYYIERGER